MLSIFPLHNFYFINFNISFFWREHNGNKVLQLFCAIPVAMVFLHIYIYFMIFFFIFSIWQQNRPTYQSTKSYILQLHLLLVLVSFFNLFSKYMLKILTTFLTSSKGHQKCECRFSFLMIIGPRKLLILNLLVWIHALYVRSVLFWKV